MCPCAVLTRRHNICGGLFSVETRKVRTYVGSERQTGGIDCWWQSTLLCCHQFLDRMPRNLLLLFRNRLTSNIPIPAGVQQIIVVFGAFHLCIFWANLSAELRNCITASSVTQWSRVDREKKCVYQYTSLVWHPVVRLRTWRQRSARVLLFTLGPLLLTDGELKEEMVDKKGISILIQIRPGFRRRSSKNQRRAGHGYHGWRATHSLVVIDPGWISCHHRRFVDVWHTMLTKIHAHGDSCVREDWN